MSAPKVPTQLQNFTGGFFTLLYKYLLALLAYITGLATIQEETFTIDYTQWAGSGGSFTFDYAGAAFPANARTTGAVVLEDWTGVDDATHSTFVVQVGTSNGGTQVAPSNDVSAATGGPFPQSIAGPGFDWFGRQIGGLTFFVRVQGGVPLDSCTAGHFVLKVFYFVAP